MMDFNRGLHLKGKIILNQNAAQLCVFITKLNQLYSVVFDIGMNCPIVKFNGKRNT